MPAHNRKRIVLALPLVFSLTAHANDQASANGFVQDAKASILLRNAYYNRDYKDNIHDNRVWGQGFIGKYESGFTQGTVGVGVDAYGLFGVRLDGGKGSNMPSFFVTDSQGHPVDELSEAGGAVKFRVSNTVLRHGTQFPLIPVLSYSDNRLLPQAFTGTLLTSKEIDGLELNAGHFTADSSRGSAAQDSNRLKSTDFFGGSYKVNELLSVSLYHSDVEDQYKKWYANTNLVMPLAKEQSLAFDFNIYRTKYADGATSAIAMGGDGNNNRNTLWSLAATYNIGAHAFTLSHQRNTGDTGYAYDFGDGGAIWVANSLYSDFNLNDERSWMASYDYNFAAVGLPGLSYKFAYARGSNIVAGDTSDGVEREIFNQLKYVVQSGSAKDLALRVRSSIYRADNQVGPDMNEVRVFVEYPIKLF